MRIIAGTHRGRRIASPEGEATRPITDRVKQSLFDRLAAADRVDGAAVLDVFAGTGSLGLECLSRGAVHVTFIEQDRSASELLEENLAMLREAEKARLMRANALGGGLALSLPRKDYSLVFFDPPYAMVADERQASRLWERMREVALASTADAWLVLRVESHARVPAIQGWGEPERFGYGSMALCIYKRNADGDVRGGHEEGRIRREDEEL